MSSNRELLDWAVENVKEWNSGYKFLSSDETGVCYSGSLPPYTSRWDHLLCVGLGTDYTTLTPQKITKEDWEEAKEIKQEIDKMKENMI